MAIAVFWGMAALLTLAVAAILSAVLWRAPAAPEAEASDIRVYRDQLHEVERDLARGIITKDEAGRLRTEVARRLLDADAGAALPDRRTSPVLPGLALVVVTLAAAFGLYLTLGVPGAPDMPLARRIEIAEAVYRNRPSQATAEAAVAGRGNPEAAVEPDFAALMDRLRSAVAARPNDLQGHILLAQNEARLGNFTAAIAAQRRVIALKGTAAAAPDHSALAELMILAAGGFVSPEAEGHLTEALSRDAKDGTALYYSGALMAQTGRPDRAFALWRGLLERSTPADPWYPALTAQIGDMALRAGVDYAPPASAPGPDAEEMAAAAALPPADRSAMIAGMVAQLSDRLATEGGPAADWARLIAAYGVLGQPDRARAIRDEAMTQFAGRESDLALIDAAASEAGITP